MDEVKMDQFDMAGNKIEEPAAAPVQAVKQPPWVKFTTEEIIPLKGYNFKCVGYGKEWEVILKCIGPTSKTIKENSEREKKARGRR